MIEKIEYKYNSTLGDWVDLVNNKLSEIIDKLNKLDHLHRRTSPFPTQCDHDFNMCFNNPNETHLVLKCEFCGLLYPVRRSPKGSLSIPTLTGGELSFAEEEGKLSIIKEDENE